MNILNTILLIIILYVTTKFIVTDLRDIFKLILKYYKIKSIEDFELENKKLKNQIKKLKIK
jgi:hypothetical protein